MVITLTLLLEADAGYVLWVGVWYVVVVVLMCQWLQMDRRNRKERSQKLSAGHAGTVHAEVSILLAPWKKANSTNAF